MAKKYVSKIVKFMLSNTQDVKRLGALEGISFSKYVKGKLDEAEGKRSWSWCSAGTG
jgi:hypothetical protein